MSAQAWEQQALDWLTKRLRAIEAEKNSAFLSCEALDWAQRADLQRDLWGRALVRGGLRPADRRWSGPWLVLSRSWAQVPWSAAWSGVAVARFAS